MTNRSSVPCFSHRPAYSLAAANRCAVGYPAFTTACHLWNATCLATERGYADQNSWNWGGYSMCPRVLFLGPETRLSSAAADESDVCICSACTAGTACSTELLRCLSGVTPELRSIRFM